MKLDPKTMPKGEDVVTINPSKKDSSDAPAIDEKFIQTVNVMGMRILHIKNGVVTVANEDNAYRFIKVENIKNI
jgi:hypothetical protein